MTTKQKNEKIQKIREISKDYVSYSGHSMLGTIKNWKRAACLFKKYDKSIIGGGLCRAMHRISDVDVYDFMDEIAAIFGKRKYTHWFPLNAEGGKQRAEVARIIAESLKN